ncbi:MAG: hypothetical protein Kow0098_27350 [Ignavibacteriaceae bacterium]
MHQTSDRSAKKFYYGFDGTYEIVSEFCIRHYRTNGTIITAGNTGTITYSDVNQIPNKEDRAGVEHLIRILHIQIFFGKD